MNNNKNSSDFFNSSTFKGIVSVLGTLLVVVIIVMIAAKVIFVSDVSVENKKTGRITSTEAKAVVTTTTKATKKTVKKTTRDFKNYDEMDIDIDIDTDEYKNQTVISAVYLHPQPNSSSENLCVIPAGAVCKVFADDNGWLYLDYEGQKGYAWHEFFSNS